MRALQIIILLFFVAVSIGWRTLGETQMSGEQITVVIGDAVMERPEKVEALRENQGVEYMYNYLQNYIREGGGVRQSLKARVSITEFRLGWGRDVMGIEVQVTENGQDLTRFHLVDTTGRSSQVKRLSKSLAKKTYDQLKTL